MSRDLLLSTLERYIPGAPAQDPEAHTGDSSPLTSSLDDEMLIPFLSTFVEGLPAHVKSIEEAMAANDLDQLKHLVHQLRGSGGMYGFMPLSEHGRGG